MPAPRMCRSRCLARQTTRRGSRCWTPLPRTRRRCRRCRPARSIRWRRARWRCCGSMWAKGWSRNKALPQAREGDRVEWTLPIGAQPDADGTRFHVWAANARRVAVVLYEGERAVATYDLTPESDGYFSGHVAGVGPGARYMYRLDGGDPRPDPAARAQPAGVHGPSLVVDSAAFAWTDSGWRGIA